MGLIFSLFDIFLTTYWSLKLVDQELKPVGTAGYKGLKHCCSELQKLGVFTFFWGKKGAGQLQAKNVIGAVVVMFVFPLFYEIHGILYIGSCVEDFVYIFVLRMFDFRGTVVYDPQK